MPLSKDQTTKIKKVLSKAYPSENAYSTETTPAGDCEKIVMTLKKMSKKELTAILQLTNDVKCDINLSTLSMAICLVFN